MPLSKTTKSRIRFAQDHKGHISRLHRPSGIIFVSHMSASEPLAEYKLEKVIAADHDTNTFVMKKYNTVLWRVTLFGTDKASFNRQVFSLSRDGRPEYSLVPCEVPMSEEEINEFSEKIITKTLLDETNLNKNVAGIISDYVVGASKKINP